MDTSKLAAISTEGLIKMREAIKSVLASRLDTTLRRGRIATFEARGYLRTVTVDKINTKTASCTETGGSHNPGGKWRVGLSQLNIVPEVRKNPLPTIPLKTPHKPSGYAGDPW